ncbi:MAG TPA: CsbD family protein [Polyangiaceae bacterium]
MNWDQIKAEWKDIRGKARVEWGKLTDDELERIRGNREQLEAALQKRYGIAKEEAQQQIDNWARKLKGIIDKKPRDAD